MIKSKQVIFPAATVIVLRNAEDGFEVLLLKRNPNLVYLGGAWVFPGGRIEKEDYTHSSLSGIHAAKNAAIREVEEESGLVVSRDRLVPVSKWVTPQGMPRRFSTWFFITIVNGVSVQVDGGEIHEFLWARPEEAIELQKEGRLELPPPIFVTLNNLTHFRAAEEAVSSLGGNGYIPRYTPRLVDVPGGVCSLYEEDASYLTGSLDTSGARHRLWMVETGWKYEGTPEQYKINDLDTE